jgi:hypothetical protein
LALLNLFVGYEIVWLRDLESALQPMSLVASLGVVRQQFGKGSTILWWNLDAVKGVLLHRSARQLHHKIFFVVVDVAEMRRRKDGRVDRVHISTTIGGNRQCGLFRLLSDHQRNRDEPGDSTQDDSHSSDSTTGRDERTYQRISFKSSFPITVNKTGLPETGPARSGFAGQFPKCPLNRPFLMPARV